MDRSDACIARTRFFPTNVVTFRCGQYALFKVRCVHFFRRPPSKSALHQGCSHVVSLLHVENDAVPCAQLPCVICLLSMRCSTKVDRKPFGRHVPNPDAPQRPECSAQYEGRHVRFHNLCRIGNTPAQASHQSVRQPAAHTHTHTHTTLGGGSSAGLHRARFSKQFGGIPASNVAVPCLR